MSFGFFLREAIRALKRNADYAKIPVVFVSAKSSPADIQHGLACGATDYMVKPFSMATFLEKVEKIAGRASGARLEARPDESAKN